MIIDKLATTADQYRDPLSGFWYGPTGNVTSSGVFVTENMAMSLSAAWACTRAICAPLGFFPFNLHRRIEGGGSELATDHPVYRLIHDAPNPEMSAMMWRCMGVAQQVNTGNAFAEIERTRAGAPIYLWPIHPSRVEIKRERETEELYYEVRNDNAPPSEIPPEDMFHPPSMMSDDGIVGKGVLRAARETFGHSMATEAYGSSWFRSGGRLSAVLKTKKRYDKEARDNLRADWKSLYGGASGEKVGILWDGMEYEGIASDPEDSQFLASRQHNIEEICRWYGVPPHIVDHLLHAHFNNVEELGLDYVRRLLPWAKLWEQEVWRKLLTVDEQAMYFAKHNMNALERADATKRTAALAQQFFNGALTLNQWMELEDRNPIGKLGDVHFVQAAMIPLEKAVNENPNLQKAKGDQVGRQQKQDSAEVIGHMEHLVQVTKSEHEQREVEYRAAQRAAANRVLSAAVTRMLAKEANEARRAAKKPETFGAWVEQFYPGRLACFIAELEVGMAAVVASDGIYDSTTISRRTQIFLNEHVELSKNALRHIAATTAGADTKLAVNALIEEWNQTRREVSL